MRRSTPHVVQQVLGYGAHAGKTAPHEIYLLILDLAEEMETMRKGYLPVAPYRLGEMARDVTVVLRRQVLHDLTGVLASMALMPKLCATRSLSSTF